MNPGVPHVLYELFLRWNLRRGPSFLKHVHFIYNIYFHSSSVNQTLWLNRVSDVVDVFLDDGCDASSIIASNLVHYSANIATIVTFFFSIIVLFYFCLNQWTFNELVKDIFELYTGVLKIAVFTTLAWITTTVLICILPRVAALILREMIGAIFTIPPWPTANYIIMFTVVFTKTVKWKICL